MAGRTFITELHRRARRFPGAYCFLRNVVRGLGTLPARLGRRFLPTSRILGPARGFFSGYDLILDGQARGEIVFDHQDCPAFAENSLVRLSGLGQDAHQPWPLFWMEIPEAVLCGRSLVPRDARGRLLTEATFSRTGDRSDPSFDHIAVGAGKFIPGNATSIVSRWGGDARGNRRYGGAGYWHWLFDSVSRLSLMERFPPDTKVITPPLSPWMRWFLEKLELKDRLIETEETGLRVEHFYFSSPSSMTGCWNPYAVDFLRRRFLHLGSAPSDGFPKCFYILREGYTRGISNEHEVRAHFQSQGWSLIAPEKLSIPDQIALFRDAEAIAGLHGSALTNLVWCSPGTRVVEFVPVDFMAGAFEWLAKANRLRHGFLICKADDRSTIHVDLNRLTDGLPHQATDDA